MDKDYEHLFYVSRKTKLLEGIASLLHWDQETYMPAEACGIRAEQHKAIAGLIHREQTGKPFEAALKKLINLKDGRILQESLSHAQKAALREWRRSYQKHIALPQRFVEDFAKTCSQAAHIWESAKKEDNFNLFLPSLAKIISMCRKRADYLKYENHPYDALLDEYEPHMTTEEVKKIFSGLRKSTLLLLNRIQTAEQVEDAFLIQRYPEAKQTAFNKRLLQLLDFPEKRGRLDLSAHPFSSSAHPTDSRITTRILPRHPMSNIRSVLHECGHAFYEMGLPAEQYGSPLGESISLGIHESQSRWWETRIGMSLPFWKHCLPLFKSHFKKAEDVSPEQFWKAINKVEPAFIRVEADEVTYALHVILRFELEISLIEGSLQPKEIPEAWNGKMQELLGIIPRNHSEGCLQDIHWSLGAFGYFPTYSLGNLYAAHFFEAFESEHPNWEARVGKGELSFIKEWLTQNIHKHGKHYTALQLLKKITGKAFSSKAFEKYLNQKYACIYRF